MFTVFGVIDRRAPAGFAGIVIGFVVFAAIIVVGPATGASINPARTFGPMLILQLFGGDVHVEPDPRLPDRGVRRRRRLRPGCTWRSPGREPSRRSRSSR